jgi:hypothetical protein
MNPVINRAHAFLTSSQVFLNNFILRGEFVLDGRGTLSFQNNLSHDEKTSRFDSGVSAVNVQFQSKDSEGTINLSGYIPLSSEEYLGNEALSKLTEVVRTN